MDNKILYLRLFNYLIALISPFIIFLVTQYTRDITDGKLSKIAVKNIKIK